MLPPWFGAQPEGVAQGTAYLPFGSPGTPRRLGQGSDLSRLAALPGLREHLPAPVIGKLARLIWMHVIHLIPFQATARLPAAVAVRCGGIALGRQLLTDCQEPALMTPYDLCRTLSA